VNLFGHIYGMRDDSVVMFVRMDGKSVRERPHREWLDDITDCQDWCSMKLHQLVKMD